MLCNKCGEPIKYAHIEGVCLTCYNKQDRAQNEKPVRPNGRMYKTAKWKLDKRAKVRAGKRKRGKL